MQKNTLFLAVLLTGTTISAVLGMTQVYSNGNGHCEHCSTTHQYDNTVTYNKHTAAGPAGTYYTQGRVVTTTSTGADATRPVAISSVAHDSTTSNNNQVIYEGSGNQTNFAHLSFIPLLYPYHPPTLYIPFIFGTMIKICLSIIQPEHLH